MEILLKSDMKILFDKLVVLLRSPYPELRARWKTVVLPSLLVFFILYVFQPFGISRMEGNKLLVLAGYAVVSSAMLAVGRTVDGGQGDTFHAAVVCTDYVGQLVLYGRGICLGAELASAGRLPVVDGGDRALSHCAVRDVEP
mgnify:CR=1 FL=1